MVAIFVDTARPDSCAQWLSSAVARGVTTNATHLRRQAPGSTVTEVAKQILALGPSELHLQVLSEDAEEAYRQAVALARLDSRVRVKVPVITTDGTVRLPLIRRCLEAEIPVNVTACTTLLQGVLTVSLGVAYVSLLWARTREAGDDPAALVQDVVSVRDRTGSRTSVMVGSLREPADLAGAVGAGADVITVPPAVLAACLYSERSVDLARQFHADASVIEL